MLAYRHFCLLLLVIPATSAVVPGGTFVGRSAAALEPQVRDVDLTGVWKSDNGTVFQIRSVNNYLFWVGRQGQSPEQTHVFHGVFRNSEEVTGRWADVPPGPRRNSGLLQAMVIDGNRIRISSSDATQLGHLLKRDGTE